MKKLPRYRQAGPIKAWPGISLAAWSDIAVTNNMSNRVGITQDLQQACQCDVLSVFERDGILTFQLNADRKVIASFPPTPARFAGVPSAIVARDKLNKLASSSDKKMGRHPQLMYLSIVGMLILINLIHEQLTNTFPTKLSGGQTDRMNHNHVRSLLVWPGIEVWRRDPSCSGMPAVTVN